MLTAEEFIARWKGSGGAEIANAHSFFLDLCDLLEVPRPPTGGPEFDDYRFEKPLEIHHPDGHVSKDRIDFYKKGCFVIEAKQAQTSDAVGAGVRRGKSSWQAHMERAFGQALKYARYLPGDRTPFLITCDVGHCFEVWTGFSGDYGRYGAGRRIMLEDFEREDVRSEFRSIFLDPWSLDPARRAAKVTREVASHLADLARSLEADGTDAEVVARFLMRCLFTMFAEDVGLLEADLFSRTLEDVWVPQPERFPAGIEALWIEMNRGGMYGPHPIRRFNGGLFHEVHAMALTRDQLERLLRAAKCDWSDVEPAIFGTMLERALNKNERHKLGAHFTPRKYIERLVRPTVIEPLAAEWNVVRGAARQVMEPENGEPGAAERRRAAKLLHDFLKRLCAIKVLDPACGTGNFLYVTFDLVKELEGEVLRELRDLGDAQLAMEMEGVRVAPEQFLGIEINPRAQAIADLVLWLGYLQWARRAKMTVSDPILRGGKNIVCGDAVLAHDERTLRRDENGRVITVWDGESKKKHPVTGKKVPDHSKTIHVYDYPNAAQAEWPDADFVVSNPPFLGKAKRRAALGDGYLDTLTRVYPDVPAGVDFVMYWWAKAAELLGRGKIRRFGFITTNSITQALNRRVISDALQRNPDLVIQFAIPDHPWVDSVSGAAVRIALTVAGVRGERAPVLAKVTREAWTGDDAVAVDLVMTEGKIIGPDLSVAKDLTTVKPLRANQGLASVGLVLFGKGFVINEAEVGSFEPEVVHPFLNGRDMLQTSRGAYVIDMYPMDESESRAKAPRAFARLFDHVRPERLQIRDPGSRSRWWRFGRDKPELRQALSRLNRYIVTAEVSKHRLFVFVDSDVRPDHKLVAITLDDAWVLGVLSSRFHVAWAVATGGHLGVGNDSCYNRTLCFDPFPFPDATEAQKAHIRQLGEAIDAHRKRVQAEDPDVWLTSIYNAMARVREGEAGGVPLDDAERAFHEKAMVGVLRSLHDELDAAVADAYGWPVNLRDEEIVERLVSLNAVRSEEEERGEVRWLSPELQRSATVKASGVQQQLDGVAAQAKPTETGMAEPQAWPKDRFEQIKSVRDFISTRPGTFTADEIARAFKSAPTATVLRHLDMLERIGVLVGYDAGLKLGCRGPRTMPLLAWPQLDHARIQGLVVRLPGQHEGRAHLPHRRFAPGSLAAHLSDFPGRVRRSSNARCTSSCRIARSAKARSRLFSFFSRSDSRDDRPDPWSIAAAIASIASARHFSITSGRTPNRAANWSTVALPDSNSITAAVRSSADRRPTAPDDVAHVASSRPAILRAGTRLSGSPGTTSFKSFRFRPPAIDTLRRPFDTRLGGRFGR